MRTLFFWFSLVAGFAAAPACAEPPSLPEAFRARLEQGTAGGGWQAVAVGLVHNNETATWFFGHIDDAAGPAPGTATRFELGSLTKAYTGVLLADLVLAGKVRLDDPLRKFLPDGFVFTDTRLGAITLEQLATHRSGLPRLPANLLPRRGDDPYADYDERALLAFLAHYRPATLDTSSGYSNLGIGLLGYVLGRVEGKGYTAALRERVLTPLKLDATGFDDVALAPGHALGEPVAAWHFDTLAGAGALRSTLADQLAFVHANLAPGEQPLRAALALARQPRGGDVGLGWQIREVRSGEQTWPLVWHNGQTGGFASFIGFRTDQQTGVVLLGNTAADLTALGLALLTDETPPPPRRVRELPTPMLADYSGLYELAPKQLMTVRVTPTGLTAQLPGQFALPLVAYDDDAFAYVDVDAQLTFDRSADRKVERLLLHQNGLNLPAPRLSDRAPHLLRQPVPIAAAALDACAGDYSLAPDTQVRISHAGETLAFQLTTLGPRPLIGYAPDRFATAEGDVELRFERDDGRVRRLVFDLAGSELVASRIDWTVKSKAGAKP